MLPRIFLDKNGAIWCILSVPNQHLKFCAIFYTKIYPGGHVSTRTNTFTFYKETGRESGGNTPPPPPPNPKECKKWRLFLFT